MTFAAPLSILQYFINEKVNINLYMAYQRRINWLKDDKESDSKPKVKVQAAMIQSKYCQAPCSVKRYKLLVCDNDGSLCEIKPTNTLWYLLYVKDPPCNNRMAKLFRFRFCLPYNEFMTLVSELKGHDLLELLIFYYFDII